MTDYGRVARPMVFASVPKQKRGVKYFVEGQRELKGLFLLPRTRLNHFVGAAIVTIELIHIFLKSLLV